MSANASNTSNTTNKRTPTFEVEVWLKNQIRDADADIAAKEQELTGMAERAAGCKYWIEVNQQRKRALEAALAAMQTAAKGGA